MQLTSSFYRVRHSIHIGEVVSCSLSIRNSCDTVNIDFLSGVRRVTSAIHEHPVVSANWKIVVNLQVFRALALAWICRLNHIYRYKLYIYIWFEVWTSLLPVIHTECHCFFKGLQYCFFDNVTLQYSTTATRRLINRCFLCNRSTETSSYHSRTEADDR